ncbi:MAG TPA: TolC family protein [Polyangiales bacterium]|nr:TolC family protein [Polyangiales bacterium]
MHERTGQDFADPRTSSNEEAERDVSGLLQKELTLDNAMRIALINNPQLRAELAGLGVARGQLVQANMIPTVDFELAVMFPQNADHPNKWEVGAGVDLTQLILRGPRTDSAQAELDAARIRAAGAALDLGYRVRLAYYDVQAAEQQLELYRTAMQAFGASYDAARELRRAGNTIELDVATEQTAYEGARVAVAEAEADLIDARERLNIQLGLFGRSIAWQVAGRLPDPAASLGDLNKLETRAIEASLELAETRAELLAVARRVGVTKLAGILPDLSAGVGAEKHDGIWFVGPSVHGTVPLFDRLQGQRIAQQAELEGMRERYQASAIEIRATLRAARDRALSAQARVEQYRDTVLPLRERVVQQTLLQYNAMQIGVFQLLQARRDQLEAARNYVVTLHEYWRSRAALEQILAGRLVASLGVMSRAQRSGSAISSGGGSVDSH